MKRKLRFAVILATAVALSAGVARATAEQDESLVDKFKKLFSRPTPSPKPRKKKRSTSSPTATKTATPSSSPNENVSPTTTSPEASASATAAESGTATASPTPTVSSQSPTPPPNTGTQYFEAVRPLSPRASPKRSSTKRAAPATFPTVTAAPEIPSETPAERPMPSLPIVVPPSASQMPTVAPSPTQTPSLAPSPQKTPVPTPLISNDAIAEAGNYPAGVRKVVDLAMQLASRHLTYKYVSADPKNGGMDSSGFIHYVLSQAGIKNVPRDAREQYIWLRKAGTFQAVLAQRDDTFELDDLKPGDLLFWASNYGTTRDPDITQTMIYLGRDKATNQRLMIGASENGVLKNQRRAGVSVFDFKVGRPNGKTSREESAPVFVGYGRIPGLTEK